jgi:hypothetical protein
MKLAYIAVFAAVAAISGCTTDAEREMRAAAGDEAQCVSYGITRSDPRYADCRLAVARLRIDREAARDAAFQRAMIGLQAAGNSMMQAGQPQYYYQQPVRLQTTCTRMGNFVNCF